MMSVLQPPPTAEELALKEQVTQALTAQGILSKIKAELRAAVFEVMHEREGFVKTRGPMAPKLSDFSMETRTTAFSLIVECLQFFHWENALRVLLAETNAENQQHDSALLAKKLGLATDGFSKKPALFQLIESRVPSSEAVVAARPVVTTKPNQFDDEDDQERQEVPVGTRPEATMKSDQFDDEDDEESQTDDVPEPKAKSREREEPTPSLASKQPERVERETEDANKNDSKGEVDESSAEIEESMAEEVPSGSELEESNYTNYEEDEESRDYTVKDNKQAAAVNPTRVQEESDGDDKAEEESHGKDKQESDDEDTVSLAAPPPAPAKLPSLPPLVGAPGNITEDGDAEDDFDAEEEAERLRKLDAALQAMEADDDTGTLQQLKASLQMELQEQDSFVSSGGFAKAEKDEEEAEESKGGNDSEYGYGSSDFEEEEEIASEISEEMESMPELSDKEDESEDGAAASAAKAEPPRVLRNDTRVDSEDALNGYDYIEDVEKGGW